MLMSGCFSRLQRQVILSSSKHQLGSVSGSPPGLMCSFCWVLTRFRPMQDEFDKLRPLCYTNTDIFLLCFSVVSPSSFQNVSEKWVPEIRCHCPKAPIILVGTQSDLREDVKVLIELDKCKEKPVSEEAAKLCAEEIKAASYIECSALTQKNLKEVFDAAIVAGIQYSDTQQQPKKSKCRTPDKMKNLSKSWWKKYCCFV